MKIEYKRKPKILFDDVAIGEVIEYERIIYMKVNSIDENGVDLEVNALNLSTGELRDLPLYDGVEVLDAILKVNTHTE